jgi:hypothetical protein
MILSAFAWSSIKRPHDSHHVLSLDLVDRPMVAVQTALRKVTGLDVFASRS